jgi:type II secretory pathway pseudopilin PulG
MKSPKKNTGFTLIEALMAAMLIGLAIAALAASSGAFTTYNAAGVDLSTAEFLIEEVREMTAVKPYTDLNTCAYNGPAKDANGELLSDFDIYTQVVTIVFVNPTDLTAVSATDQNLRRVTVTILKNNREITSSSWIRANLN